jgi:hypothetical protein
MTTKVDEFQHLISAVVKGDAEAIRFYNDIYNTLHFWDDLIDRDKAIDDSDIHDMMDTLLFRLPCNKFYGKYEHLLRPILVMSIYNWMAATKLERAPIDATDLHASFILRSAYADLLSIGATLFHKRIEAVDLIIEVRRQIHHEGFNQYLVNLTNEKANREGV